MYGKYGPTRRMVQYLAYFAFNEIPTRDTIATTAISH